VAIKSTIYKIDMQIANIDDNYYADHNLTIASHPSENEERMMVRLLAFALNSSESLQFGNGLTDPDEADIWEKYLTGSIKLWIDMGQPEEKTILKACGKSEKVKIYTYKSNSCQWWDSVVSKLTRAKNLEVYHIEPKSVDSLSEMVEKSMSLLYTIQDDEIWVRDNKDRSVNVKMKTLFSKD